MSQNNVDLLGQTTAASTETINADLTDLRDAAASMEYSAGKVVDAGSDLGLEGAAGDAAMDACVTISRKLRACVDEIERLSAAGTAAQAAWSVGQARRDPGVDAHWSSPNDPDRPEPASASLCDNAARQLWGSVQPVHQG